MLRVVAWVPRQGVAWWTGHPGGFIRRVGSFAI